MFYVYLILALILGTTIGIMMMAIFQARRYSDKYHGIIIVDETPNGIVYKIELAGDPELLAFEKRVTFLVVSPDYEKLLSQ